MLRILFVFVVLAAVLLSAVVGFSFYVSQPVVQGDRESFEPLIADPELALTFARTGDALIWVTAHRGDALIGVDLTERYGSETDDLIEFAAQFDHSVLDGVRQQTFTLDSLVMPLNFSAPSVAAGTNFKEHADEIYSDEPPFLFPKLTQPGHWNAPVRFVERLDYEAELCMFPLADIESPEVLPGFGLVLCNDFTDRWTLVTELDLGEPLGTTGFPNGKGCETCLPTGYLVVIPRAPDFYLSLDLSLAVNDRLRQKFHMKEVILPIEDIVAQAFTRQETGYIKGDEVIRLLPQGKIPRGSLILTGTAAGVMFRPSNLWSQQFYLQSGDVVWTEARYLGHLRNVVN